MLIIIGVIQNSVLENVIEKIEISLKLNLSNWVDNFKYLYKEIINSFYNYTLNNLLNNKGKRLEKDINKYIDFFTGRKITLISDTTRKNIKEFIRKSIKEGKTIKDIEIGIRKVYRDFSKSRARVIALTEVAGISNYAMLQSAIDSKKDLEKKWIPIIDGKTRDSHAFMANHESIDLDKPFRVGDTKMLFPGDPTGTAKEVINCRCSIKFIER